MFVVDGLRHVIKERFPVIYIFTHSTLPTSSSSKSHDPFDLTKMAICRYEAVRKGSCNGGMNCRFEHDMTEGQSSSTAQNRSSKIISNRPTTTSSVSCRFFTQGCCNKRSSCVYLHDSQAVDNQNRHVNVKETAASSLQASTETIKTTFTTTVQYSTKMSAMSGCYLFELQFLS